MIVFSICKNVFCSNTSSWFVTDFKTVESLSFNVMLDSKSKEEVSLIKSFFCLIFLFELLVDIVDEYKDDFY